MKGIMKLIILSATLLAPFIASGQCGNGSTTFVTTTNYVIRQDGNHVYAYAASSISGPDAPFWQLYVSSWLYRDSTFLAGFLKDTNPTWGGAVSRSYTRTLQTDGPGGYHMDAYHSAYNPDCSISAPPYWNGFDGNTHSGTVTVTRPVIQRTVVPYFLGSGVTSSYDYSSQTTMSVANAYGAPETPQWSFSYGAGSTFGNLSCSSCASSVFTATAPSTGCGAYNVVIQASFNGFLSNPFWIDIQKPSSLTYIRTDQTPPPQGGWESVIVSKVTDGCNQLMGNIGVNEVFTTWADNNGSNWTAPLLASGWQGLTFDNLLWAYALKDLLYEIPGQNYYPTPLANGQNGYSQSGASLGSTHSQQFRAGSSYNGGPGGIPYGYGPIPGSLTAAQGVLVQTNQHYHWLDHGSYF